MRLFPLNRLEHIREKEAKIRQDLGEDISIEYYEGVPGRTDPPYSKPIYLPENIKIQVERSLVHWLTEVEIDEMEVGFLKIGDCRILSDYNSRTYFENCQQNKFKITTSDGIKLRAKTIHPSSMKTQVIVFCNRVLHGK